MGNKKEFSGELKFINLADVIQILGGNESTGILRLSNPYIPASGLIYFLNGDPVNATSGHQQGVDAIYAMFGWIDGKFDFHNEYVNDKNVINKSRMQILLNAMKMLDDGVIKKIGAKNHDTESTSQNDMPDKKEHIPVIRGPMVDYMHIIDEKRVNAEHNIVTEGDHGNWIWVILEGVMEIARQTPDGSMAIVRLGEGSFIGNFSSLVFSEILRSATVTAVENVHLGLLDTQHLAGEYSSLSLDFRRLLLSQSGRLTKITDRVVEAAKKQLLIYDCIMDKKLFMEKGTSSKDVYSITDGEICVVGQTAKGYIPQMTLKKEDVFGYIPFMNIGHEPCEASIFVSKNMEADRLDIDYLMNEYDGLSGTLKRLIENTSTCISVTTRLVNYYLVKNNAE